MSEREEQHGSGHGGAPAFTKLAPFIELLLKMTRSRTAFLKSAPSKLALARKMSKHETPSALASSAPYSVRLGHHNLFEVSFLEGRVDHQRPAQRAPKEALAVEHAAAQIEQLV